MGGGISSTEIVRVAKSAGSTSLSIPTTKKANYFTISYANGSDYDFVMIPNDLGAGLDCYNRGNFQQTYNVTITYNNNSIDISAFNFSSGASGFTIVVFYY